MQITERSYKLSFFIPIHHCCFGMVDACRDSRSRNIHRGSNNNVQPHCFQCKKQMICRNNKETKYTEIKNTGSHQRWIPCFFHMVGKLLPADTKLARRFGNIAASLQESIQYLLLFLLFDDRVQCFRLQGPPVVRCPAVIRLQ